VQKPAARPDLIVGAKVDVDVPPGRPPQRVQVRETPQNTQTASATQTAPARNTAAPSPPASSANEQPAPRPVADDAPVVTTPPRPPVDIPAQPAAATPAARPAPVTPEQVVRLLPLPPEQAAQVVVPPADIIDTILPALPAPVIAAAALAQETAQTLLTLPASAPAALAQAPLPAAPVTATILPATAQAAPPASGPAQNLIDTILQLNAVPAATTAATAAATAAAAPPSAPIFRFLAVPPPLTAPLTAVPVTLPAAVPFSLSPLPLNAARAAALALNPPAAELTTWPGAPESLIAVPPAATQQIPKFDAQVTAIAAPAIIFAAPPGQAAATTPAVIPPLHVPPIPIPQGRAETIQATVRGLTAQNFPVLTLSFPALNAVQDFVMQFPAGNLPPHAQVSILPQPGALPAAALLPQALPAFDMSGTTAWPALDEAFQSLQHAAPQVAQMMAQTAIPNPAAPARLPAVALMFIAAVQGGDLQSWLGEKTIDTLRRIGKADVVGRLSRDLGAINRLAGADPAGPQDWRTMPLPMMWDNQAHRIFLHYRHDREQGAQGAEGTKGTRFILDVAPARMGRVQLDGLHRPAPDAQATGRLDLIVRTGEQLSPNMQQTMRRLYVQALEQAALSGELSFQTKPGQWVEVKTA
jgi:hypothetical protein